MHLVSSQRTAITYPPCTKPIPQALAPHTCQTLGRLPKDVHHTPAMRLASSSRACSTRRSAALPPAVLHGPSPPSSSPPDTDDCLSSAMRVDGAPAPSSLAPRRAPRLPTAAAGSAATPARTAAVVLVATAAAGAALEVRGGGGALEPNARGGFRAEGADARRGPCPAARCVCS